MSTIAFNQSDESSLSFRLAYECYADHSSRRYLRGSHES